MTTKLIVQDNVHQQSTFDLPISLQNSNERIANESAKCFPVAPRAFDILVIDGTQSSPHGIEQNLTQDHTGRSATETLRPSFRHFCQPRKPCDPVVGMWRPHPLPKNPGKTMARYPTSHSEASKSNFLKLCHGNPENPK
ncbi:hypothetical protein WN48_07452 [Eufriesea mexicana]|uniref:Uncharacterized protein n=1 Tax=Eufriesea mexicana TaxID=516756 RepID=A0A310SBE0_9HYME|nr:hypothetical protein WN48_08359 [Eufriesea mexicana]OAD62198.1 hypothetical protein WN48_07452 [Eufriesea mexicana]